MAKFGQQDDMGFIIIGVSQLSVKLVELNNLGLISADTMAASSAATKNPRTSNLTLGSLGIQQNKHI